MLLNEKNSRLTLCGELALLVAVIINSFSVVLMLYSGSGISAISSVPFAFSEAFPKLTLGTWTYIFQGLLIASLMYLRKNQNRRKEVSIDEPLNIDWDGNELLLMDVLTSDQAQVGEELERNAERSALLAAVQALNPRERQIMELRFGLRDGVEHTQKEVADSIGISQSYISRLEKRIIKRLRQQIESLV